MLYNDDMIIRKYRKEDYEQVEKICMDTGKGSFAIKPKKRKAVALMYIDYNLEYEPEHIFVAEEDGEIAGYICYGCDLEKLRNAVYGELGKRVKKINVFYLWFLKICTKTSLKLGKKYGGSGFHLNIAPKYQSRHLGPKLLSVLGKHLKEEMGYGKMYLVTESRKTRGYGFYTHYGFKEADHCGAGTLCLTYDLSSIEEKLEKHGLDYSLIVGEKESA